MKFTETSPHLEQNTKLLMVEKGHHKFSNHVRNLSDDIKIHLKSQIQEYYFERGWGLKLVARNVLGISYTNCRTLFRLLELTFNKGYNVCNDTLRAFRKQKAIEENKEETGFRHPDLLRYSKTTHRGVQGYYFNTSTQSYVWLRSTWEFIYAKFLNKAGIKWKIEQRYFRLSDGTKYSPDFYIYNDTWELQKIVEIKGYFDKRAYKVELLREEFYKDSKIDIILIRDIKLYLENDLTYEKELKTWKTIRKSKEFILQE